MNPDEQSLLDARLNALTEKIIGCAFRVSNTLGCGFLEKVYENALAYELRKCGLDAQQQRAIKVCYDEMIVGNFFADLVIADLVIVELKATSEVHDIAAAQCINYLAATGLPLCLLLNFGNARVQVRRFRN